MTSYEQEKANLKSKCASVRQRPAWPMQVEPRILCVVGESLGKDEHAAIDDPSIPDKYFIGAAGSLLNKLLSESNLIRSSMHITNVVKVYIPSVPNKYAYLHSIGLPITDFLPLLTAELQAVQPAAILAAGAIALEALTGKTDITKWRGSLLDCILDGVDSVVVPTFHPAYLQRGQMKYYPYVRADIKQFAEVGFGFHNPEPTYSALIDPTLTESLDYLSDIYLNSTHTCFDIETVGAEKITCVGWTKDDQHAICIPFRHAGLKNRWTEPEQIMLCHAMREVYHKPGLVKIGQNMHYDMHFLLPLLGFPREPLFDTMYAHALIHADAKHDLGFLTSVYTDLPYHKDENKDWEIKTVPHDQILWEYNSKDVIATHRVYEKLMQDLHEYELYNFFAGYVMPFRRVLFEMEHRGLRVNKRLREEWKTFVEEDELPIALDIVNKMAGQDLNPNSSKQVGGYLENKLGIRVRKTKLGNYSVKEEHIEAMIARNPKHRAFLKQILCARVLKSKDLGTYLTAPLSADGRMRTGFGTTVTGRLSSHANHKKEGSNLQNLPEKFREIYLPEEGHVFLEPDMSQAEALEMVYLMKNEVLKKRMLAGEKIHKIVGEWIYGKPGDKLTPEEYLTSKRCVHGSNYNMGEQKFATVIEKSVAEARELRRQYHSVVPQLRQYHLEVQNQLNSTRRLTTPYGRVRIFTGRLNDEAFRSGYAQIPQSTVVDTLNLGALGLWLCKPDEVYIAMQGHDSLLISTPPELINELSKLIVLHLQDLREHEVNGDMLIIPVNIGEPKNNWLGKKKL